MAEGKVQRHNRWRLELVCYLCFTVPFSFLPIGILYGIRMSDGYYLTLPEIVADGGVLTIAISLAAEALAHLVASGTKWREVKAFAAAFSAWVIGWASAFYALRQAHGPKNLVFFVDVALALLIASIVVATTCRLLPEDN